MLLSSIIVQTKSVEVDFPGLEGFKVTISAISRELSRKIREESMVSKIDPRLKMPVEELDEEAFLVKFSKVAVLGWRGLKYKHLSQLVLVDEKLIDDLEAEVDFSHENVMELIKSSQVFDSWINQEVFSLERFRD